MSKKWWCFFGVHEYKVIDSGPLRVIDDNDRTVSLGRWYDMRCECCGNLKAKKT